MSEQPKTAHQNCAAHNCPMLGTATRNTTGSDEWFCFIHFAAEPKRWGEISAELNRLGWLVAITRSIRAGRYDEKATAKEIALNQSKHLLEGDHETRAAYLARLETTLQQACAAPAPKTESMFDKEE